jgi:hypothetical protein
MARRTLTSYLYLWRSWAYGHHTLPVGKILNGESTAHYICVLSLGKESCQTNVGMPSSAPVTLCVSELEVEVKSILGDRKQVRMPTEKSAWAGHLWFRN